MVRVPGRQDPTVSPPAISGRTGQDLHGVTPVTAATLVTFRLAGSPRADPALAGLITEVTTVPVGTSVPGLPASASPASAYSSPLLTSPGTLVLDLSDLD
jgi:hypothetical protein